MKKLFSRVVYSGRPEICLDVAQWASKKGMPVISLHPPVDNEVQPLLQGDRRALIIYGTQQEYLQREQSLVTIENAGIRDLIGLVELPDGKVCYEGNWYLPYLRMEPAYKRRFRWSKRSLLGDYYSLLSLWAEGFYHWFHDVLPRLETAIQHLPSNTKFVIGRDPEPWQLESLAAYGIGVDNLVEQREGEFTAVERLWFSTPLGHASFGSGKVVRRVGDRLVRHFADGLGQGVESIYVSRRNARSRRVVNESELENVLKSYGFQLIQCEDLSLREQIGTFSGARSIMGPHGAGLMNMIFCRRSNCNVWELTAQENTEPCYLVLSGQLGHKFKRLTGQIVSGSDGDMTMDSRIVEEELRS